MEASVATRSKMSALISGDHEKEKLEYIRDCLPLTKELRVDMARLEIPVSGWTCLSTIQIQCQ